MHAPQSMPVPLRSDPGGALRVAGTRVLLDSVVSSFDAGATAEEICHQYPSVTLRDVYAVLSYVLAHRDEVNAYLAARAETAAAVREKFESVHSAAGIRARLQARRRLG